MWQLQSQKRSVEERPTDRSVGPLSGKHPRFTIQSTQPHSIGYLIKTVCEQNTIIELIVEKTVVWLFDFAWHATESKMSTKAKSVFLVFINWTATQASKSLAFRTAAEGRTKKRLAEPHAVNHIGNSTIDNLAFRDLVVKFLKHRVKKRLLARAELKHYWRFLQQSNREP